MLEDGVESLPALLSGYEQHGGLGLHWQVGMIGWEGPVRCTGQQHACWLHMDSNPACRHIAPPIECQRPVTATPSPQLFAFDRHVERPAGGLLASYTACCGRDAHAGHRHIKSFVQPRYTLGPQTVHSFNYHKGRHAVTTGGTRIDGPLLKPGQQVGSWVLLLAVAGRGTCAAPAVARWFECCCHCSLPCCSPLPIRPSPWCSLICHHYPAQVSYQGAVVHHYISRSLADFAVKQERRDGTGNVKQVGWLACCRQPCCRCSAAGVLQEAFRSVAAIQPLGPSLPAPPSAFLAAALRPAQLAPQVHGAMHGSSGAGPAACGSL